MTFRQEVNVQCYANVSVEADASMISLFVADKQEDLSSPTDLVMWASEAKALRKALKAALKALKGS